MPDTKLSILRIHHGDVTSTLPWNRGVDRIPGCPGGQLQRGDEKQGRLSCQRAVPFFHFCSHFNGGSLSITEWFRHSLLVPWTFWSKWPGQRWGGPGPSGHLQQFLFRLFSLGVCERSASDLILPSVAQSLFPSLHLSWYQLAFYLLASLLYFFWKIVFLPSSSFT